MPINFPESKSTAGQVSNTNNTVTVRTPVPGKASSAPATSFPTKLEQVQNVNTKFGLPDNAVLKFNKATGMWEPVEYRAMTGDPVVTKRYSFVDSLEWLVEHNMNTTAFRETLVLNDGTKFNAKTRIIDQNRFVVYLTSAESGWVDVVFNTSA